MDKKGKVKPINFLIGTALTLGIILMFIFGANMFGIKIIPQQVVSPVPGISAPSGSDTAQQCAVNPSVVSAITDTLNAGTAVTTTNYYISNGKYTGTTAPTYTGSANVLLTASNYLNKVVKGVPINCGANQLTGDMYYQANASLTYYSDNGLTSLSQNVVNETVKSAGSAYNWKLHFQGVDKKSTGKMLFIVELSVPANVSSITMSNGAVSVPVPNGYTRQLTNGYASAFLLPAIIGTNPMDYYLTVQSATGKVVTGQVYTTVYSLEPFVETDGTFSNGDTAFDSLNTAKYHYTYTKNFVIV